MKAQYRTVQPSRRWNRTARLPVATALVFPFLAPVTLGLPFGAEHQANEVWVTQIICAIPTLAIIGMWIRLPFVRVQVGPDSLRVSSWWSVRDYPKPAIR